MAERLISETIAICMFLLAALVLVVVAYFYLTGVMGVHIAPVS
ncbi:MAG: hypothetical protein QW751_01600 [Candidatus Aenigmatarchaeota archaeon]